MITSFVFCFIFEAYKVLVWKPAAAQPASSRKRKSLRAPNDEEMGTWEAKGFTKSRGTRYPNAYEDCVAWATAKHETVCTMGDKK